MSCPVCKSSNSEIIEGVFLIGHFDFLELMKNKDYKVTAMKMNHCKNCGVLRSISES